jgi:hypothetical protein
MWGKDKKDDKGGWCEEGEGDIEGRSNGEEERGCDYERGAG